MSTPAATARYVIAADDRSKAAVASALRGFRDMERGIKGSLRVLNTGLAIFLGVQLKQGFRNVLQATAQSTEGQRGFARALEETQRAAKNLLAAKSGLPAATQNMKELRDILKDPSVVAAADAITSTLIKGFGNAAIAIGKVVGGIRELTKERTITAAKTRQDVVDALEFQIENIDAQLERARSKNARVKGEASFGIGTTGGATVAFLQAERKRLLEAQQRVLDLPATPARGHGALGSPPSIESRTKAAIDRERRAEEARIEVLKHSTEILKAEGKLLEFRHDQTMKSVDAAGEYLDELKATRQEAATFMKTMNPQVRQEMEANFEYLNDLHRESINEMTDYVRAAREGMQGALADFLFDPFEDGLKGMVKSFVDTIRRMIAEMAAAKIFASKEAGGFGFGGFLEGIFGGKGGAGIAPGENDWMKRAPGVGLPDLGKFFKFPLPGFARGGSFMVGGNSGTDQNVVSFRASRGERVDITPPGGGSAPVVNINIHNDNRGASVDFIRALPEHDRRLAEQIEFRVVDGLRRNKYRMA